MKTPKALRDHVVDALLALLVVVGALETALRYAADGRTSGDTWLAAVETALILLPLTVWHQSRFAAGAGVWLVAAGVSMVNERLVVTTTSIYIGGLAAALLLGGVKARRPALLGLAITIAGAAIVVHNDPVHQPGDQFFVPLLFSIAWMVGFALRARSGQAEAAEARAAMLERDRERASLQAASDERARLARELHDIVGHSVSVMTVQASGVRRMLTPEQEDERQALLSVERTGREALAEMRLLVGALRDPEEAPSLAPQPSLTHLETLLQHARDAGIDASAVVEGRPVALPAGVDLTAYRLVQEALTNTVKHADARTAHVRIRHTSSHIEVEICDDGRTTNNDTEPGHGLEGIRERVAIYHGDLEVGPQVGGGFRLLGQAAGSDMTTRILIADDQALVRAGFRMILQAEDDLVVVAEAVDGRDAVQQAAQHQPDVILMDVRMPDVDGIEATRQVMAFDRPPKVVILTTFHMDEYVYDALRAGASGFLLKDVPPEQLVSGIHSVTSGEALLAPAVTRQIIEQYLRRPPERQLESPLPHLTTRERQVLELVAQGLSNAEIAATLFVSTTTVKTHVARILTKLDLRDRVQAVVLAYERGIVRPGTSSLPAARTGAPKGVT